MPWTKTSMTTRERWWMRSPFDAPGKSQLAFTARAPNARPRFSPPTRASRNGVACRRRAHGRGPLRAPGATPTLATSAVTPIWSRTHQSLVRTARREAPRRGRGAGLRNPLARARVRCRPPAASFLTASTGAHGPGRTVAAASPRPRMGHPWVSIRSSAAAPWPEAVLGMFSSDRQVRLDRVAGS